MQNVLGKERVEEEPTVEPKAKRKKQIKRCPELVVFQHTEVNHRSLVLRTQLPENQPDEGDACDDRKPRYKLALKPIILLAFLKDILEACKPDRQQANAKPIWAPTGIRILKRRILQIRTHWEHREQA